MRASERSTVYVIRKMRESKYILQNRRGSLLLYKSSPTPVVEPLQLLFQYELCRTSESGNEISVQDTSRIIAH